MKKLILLLLFIPLFSFSFFSNAVPIPAPKHKPNAIHKPILSVAFPIIIPASNPIPAPKDILDSFIVIVKYVFSLFFSVTPNTSSIVKFY